MHRMLSRSGLVWLFITPTILVTLGLLGAMVFGCGANACTRAPDMMGPLLNVGFVIGGLAWAPLALLAASAYLVSSVIASRYGREKGKVEDWHGGQEDA